ncbi:MAG: hemerythrin domain-containing protein [Candidatus Scalindua sp.]
MSALIEEFKKEHSEIIEALKEVEELGILTKEGQAKLMSVKAALLEHLKEEDEKFYPILRKEAEQNKKLKEELDIFAKDLENVSKVVLEFFDRFDKGVLGTRLLWDFETLIIVLRNRIMNEEIFLYGYFEKVA